MEKQQRETVEWLNIWWQDAKSDKKRWVLLGDSVFRSVRGPLHEKVSPMGIVVDYWGTSSHLADELFEHELKTFFEVNDYIYELAIINWGGHHGLKMRCSEEKTEYNIFYQYYEQYIKYIKAKCKNIVITSVTHEVMLDDIKKLNEYNNNEIKVRNAIARELTKKHGLKFIDLYDIMFSNKDVFPHKDHVHFEKRADYYMADILYDSIFLNKSVNKSNIDNINRIKIVDDVKEYNRMIYTNPVVFYGTGKVGQCFFRYTKLINGSVAAFVISDGEDKTVFQDIERPVYHCSELPQDLQNCNIIISMATIPDKIHINTQGEVCGVTEQVRSFIEEYVRIFG